MSLKQPGGATANNLFEVQRIIRYAHLTISFHQLRTEKLSWDLHRHFSSDLKAWLHGERESNSRARLRTEHSVTSTGLLKITGERKIQASELAASRAAIST